MIGRRGLDADSPSDALRDGTPPVGPCDRSLVPQFTGCLNDGKGAETVSSKADRERPEQWQGVLDWVGR
jgi:hypothetical protein